MQHEKALYLLPLAHFIWSWFAEMEVLCADVNLPVTARMTNAGGLQHYVSIIIIHLMLLHHFKRVTSGH